ncbi:MAG: RES domain-containing protein [Chitinispirillaceae bacterium]|nr:RES domain-containing protein [Chitinispirillaceae bacterium]
MKVRTWRLVNKRYAEEVFSGEGAALAGGRWNSPGVRIVYTAETLSLAVLEILAGGASMLLLGAYVKVAAVFDDSAVEEIGLLPMNWDEYPPGPATQSIGDAWVKKGKGLVLRVPSAVVPGEFNFLINSAHPDFSARINQGGPEPFKLNPRLVRQA